MEKHDDFDMELMEVEGNIETWLLGDDVYNYCHLVRGLKRWHTMDAIGELIPVKIGLARRLEAGRDRWIARELTWEQLTPTEVKP